MKGISYREVAAQFGFPQAVFEQKGRTVEVHVGCGDAVLPVRNSTVDRIKTALVNAAYRNNCRSNRKIGMTHIPA